ncbi:MAG: DNA primase DnaG [Candidatus Hydrothermarchaeales archaeon]
MGKIDLGTTKYVIHALIETSGVIEKPDVVGAIFGQTEGLLGADLDLRELQKTGRIGRIEVNVKSKGGKSEGKITIPSSLDQVETAILAAALETIDRVGPCKAKISVEKIEDVRISKRRRVIERAKDILSTMVEDITPDSIEVTEEVKHAMRLGEIIKYGPENLPAGPNIDASDAVIVVEGRADVLNLLKNGIKNAIAVEGTSIPKGIIDLSKKKTVTVFVDGDRGGDLIVKELLQVAEVDYVARAPPGKEVEELTKKELFKALRNKTPAEQGLVEVENRFAVATSARNSSLQKELGKVKAGIPQKEKPKYAQKKDSKTEMYGRLFKDLSGTFKAYLLDQESNIIKEVAVRDLASALTNSKEKVSVVIFDGVITQRLVDISSGKEVECLVGATIGNITKKPTELRLLTSKDLGVF